MNPLRPLVLENRAAGALELVTGAAFTAAAAATDWVGLLIALPVAALVFAAWIHRLIWAGAIAQDLEAAREPPVTEVASPAMTVLRGFVPGTAVAAGLFGVSRAIGLYAPAAALQVGLGLATLAVAWRLSRWEREHDARIVGTGRGENAELYVIPRSRTPP